MIEFAEWLRTESGKALLLAFAIGGSIFGLLGSGYYASSASETYSCSDGTTVTTSPRTDTSLSKFQIQLGPVEPLDLDDIGKDLTGGPTCNKVVKVLGFRADSYGGAGVALGLPLAGVCFLASCIVIWLLKKDAP